MNFVEVYNPNNTAYSMGRLPNDVRTQIIASGEKENVLLARLLLLNADSRGIIPTLSGL